MTVPNFRSPTNPQLIALPPGYGRKVRSTAVVVGVSQLIILAFIVIAVIFVVTSERGAGNPLWSVSAITGLVSYPPVIGVLVNVFRVGGGMSGDFVHEPRARRLLAVLRAWWIASLVVALGALVGQAVGYAHVFGNGARRAAIVDVFPFVYVVLVVGIGTALYFTGRSLLVPNQRALARMWAARR